MSKQMQTEKQSVSTSAKSLVNKLDRQATANAKLIGTTFKEVIEAYLEVAGRGWSATTKRSEAARLRSLLPVLDSNGFNPEAIQGDLGTTVGAYTLKTQFIRLAKLYDFCLEVEVVRITANPFRHYMNKIAPNRFKTTSVYRPKQVGKSFEDVKDLLSAITKSEVRETVSFLLMSGLRISELGTITHKDGRYYVIGKGNKMRELLVEPPKTIAAAWEVRSELGKFGLTPHSLRKLAATKMLEAGVPLTGVQQVFGWASLGTVNSYAQRMDFDRLKQVTKEVFSE